MDLQLILDDLSARARRHADRVRELLTELDPTSDALDVGRLWPAVALLQETAGIAATLAATGPVPAPEGSGTREALPEALSGSQGVAGLVIGPLADALDLSDPEDDWTFDQLLGVIRERVEDLRKANVRIDDARRNLDVFAGQVAEAASASVGLERDRQALVERVRSQRLERGALLQALRAHLGRSETQSTVGELITELVERDQDERWIYDRLRMDLRVALGDLPRDTTDEQLVSIARSMREDVARMRKSLGEHQRATRVLGAAARTELIDVAKALGTYAPGMDDMPDDELRTTVHTIARQVLADHEMQSRHAEQWRKLLGDIAERIGLGRGAQAPEILRGLSALHERAYGVDSWSNWADEMAEALGMPADDNDSTWTDEGLGLLVDLARDAIAKSGRRVAELGAELRLDPAQTTWSAMLGRVRELYSRPRGVGVDDLARALGDETPVATSDWPHLIDRVREIVSLRANAWRESTRQLAQVLGHGDDSERAWASLLDDVRSAVRARDLLSTDALADALGRQSGPPTGDLTGYVVGLLDEVRELVERSSARSSAAARQLHDALGHDPKREPAWADMLTEVRHQAQLVADLTHDVTAIPEGMRAGLAGALAAPGVDLSATEWPRLIELAAALAKRENGRPSAPPVSTPPATAPHVGPLSTKDVPVGPSVDDFSGVNRGEPA